VVALAPYAWQDHYTPIPIVLSPSCKAEKGADLAIWIKRVVTAWKAHEYGESLHGPIWAIASDGESSFHILKFQMCMSEIVDPLSELGKTLYCLAGINCNIGPDGISHTSDPKHVIKSKAT
jgi:hypothetical protein